MKYTINYHTGAGNKIVESDDLDYIKALADEGASYTQQPITIDDERGNAVARREWYGVKLEDGDAEDPIQFGLFGFYSDWHDQ